MATPPAAGFDFGALMQQAGRALQNNLYEQIQGRPAPWTESGRRYDQLRELQGAAVNKQLGDLTRPASTARQRASDYLTEGTALQGLANSAAEADMRRRLGFAQGMTGVKGTLQNQETQALGERTRIGDVSFGNRTNTLTKAELDKLGARVQGQRALLELMTGHEARAQQNQLDFGENLVSSVMGSVDRMNQMAMQEAERQRSWSNPQNVMGMLGNIAAIGSLFV
jgi:hypothetical protein